MKAFIDTSSLIKKYVAEGDYLEFDKLLDRVSRVIISPVTGLELNSALARKLIEKVTTHPPPKHKTYR